jgi:hypothetical protein
VEYLGGAVLVFGIGLMLAGWLLRTLRTAEFGCAICIAGILLLWLAPPPQGKGPNWRGMCGINLKQIGLSLWAYDNVNSSLPARGTRMPNGQRGLSWRVTILPHMENASLHAQFHLAEAWNSAHNLPLAKQRPDVLVCPLVSRQLKTGRETSYYAIAGPDGCWPEDEGVSLAELKDGTSNTLLVVESHSIKAVWSEPRDLDADTATWRIGQSPQLSSLHPRGVMAVFADGSSQYLSDKTDPEVLKQLANRHDGLPAPDWEDAQR